MGKGLSIKERLIKAFRRVLGIASVAAIAGVIALIVIDHQYSSALQNYGFSQGDIGKAVASFTGTRAYMLAVIGYDDEENIQSAIEGHDAMKEKFVNIYWPEVANTLTSNAEKEVYDKVSAELENYWTIEEEAMTKGANSIVNKAAQKIAAGELEPIYNEIYQELVELMSINVEQGDRLSSLLSLTSRILIIAILVLIVLSSSYATRLGVKVAKGISAPLDALGNRLSSFAKGDLILARCFFSPAMTA